jgi:DNA-binding transcriptional MerR regulator
LGLCIFELFSSPNHTNNQTKLPYKEKDIEKKYYSIGEVSTMFKVAPSLIRFWESEFEMIQPQKNRRGNRQFTAKDIESIRLIYNLVKERGYTLQGAKEMLKTDRHKSKDKLELLDSLQRVRSFLVDLKKQMDE